MLAGTVDYISVPRGEPPPGRSRARLPRMKRLHTAVVLMTVPLALAKIAAADLSGNWIIDGDVQGNAVSLACVVKQGADARATR
jgi:hypothetical protein